MTFDRIGLWALLAAACMLLACDEPTADETSTHQETRPMPRSSAPHSPADYFALRLRPGQDLKQELQAFAKTRRLHAGFVASAVGSLTEVHLRYANQEVGARQTGHFEIVSLSGTLTAEGMHVHMSVADATGAVTGGHLLDGNRVYTTVELVIGEVTDLRFAREVDSTYGYRELTVERRRSGPGQAPRRNLIAPSD